MSELLVRTAKRLVIDRDAKKQVLLAIFHTSDDKVFKENDLVSELAVLMKKHNVEYMNISLSDVKDVTL